MKKICILFAAAILFSNCSQTFYLGKSPQAHFTYPNANVEPVGQVTGIYKKTKLFGPPPVTPTVQRTAWNDALSKSNGGNVLINVDTYYKLSIFLIFQTLTYRVEGTAAKQDVGLQNIGGGK
ncbi:MAG: hypothetical protein AAF363_10365 [Bacteroidota bacterium]